MESLTNFFTEYGWVITLIAVAGIAILGILKYCNVFKKIDEDKRHYLYILISVLFSVVVTGIYLACIGQFSPNYMIAITVAVYALNQTFYNIFKVTPVNDLFVTILDFIKGLFIKSGSETEDDNDDGGSNEGT